MKNSIDFLIIGAQKSATTSLFKYISEHPEIYMPRAKEINFFSNDRKFAKGVNWYLKNYFSSVNYTNVIGEASPSYMCYEKVPPRIFDSFPEVKLIAILRNPIDRAYSHYRMDEQKKSYKKDFSESLKEVIEMKKSEDDSTIIDNKYVRFGEYGQILSNYLNFFSIQNIKIIFTEDLKKAPVEIMRGIFKFLGVSDDFKSQIFMKEYHIGGQKRFLFIEKLMNFRWIKFIASLLLPPKLRGALGFWIITKFTVKPKIEKGIKKYIRDVLKEYYRKDIEKLEKNFNIKVPWKEFNNLDKVDV